MACFGTNLPKLDLTARPNAYVMLPLFYKDILNFYSNLLQVFQTRGEEFLLAKLAKLMFPGWQIFFESIWEDNQAIRDVVLQHVREHTEGLTRPNMWFTPYEMKAALLKSSDEFQAQLTRQLEEGQTAFDLWTSQINPTSYDSEYKDLLEGHNTPQNAQGPPRYIT